MINKFGFYSSCLEASTLDADVIDDIDDLFELNKADNIDHANNIYVMVQITTFTPVIVGTHKIPTV